MRNGNKIKKKWTLTEQWTEKGHTRNEANLNGIS
jgi:hypothetical protein